ncbi:ABC transporter permease [Catalinimonas niigatensis]|uniref:ABC transporter permease n=1 Tax=Catalinimonas niigatensis TaxID=1397264 RepID=UPI002665B140|nr:ABC transporter permease [Catalinimonas niigatensis]WPP51373.1 FtsX-like permease family protein [Catalinimonas niigatensis]
MFRHQLLLIYRNFQRFRSTFLINLIGLSSGLCCVLLIYLWVNDELSVDKFHEKDSKLYQVIEHQQHAENIITTEGTAGLLAASLAEDMPEVEYATVVTPSSWFGNFTLSVENSGEIKNIKAPGQFVGKDFFTVFSYHLKEGEESQVLADKNSIVISEDLARRLFNTTENVVGKTLEWHLLHFTKQVTITGLFEGTPPQSSAQFDFALSFDVFREINPSIAEWGNHGPHTYLVLQEGTDIKAFNDKIEGYMNSKTDFNTFRTLFARPYSEGYLYGTYENGKQAGGRIEYVRLFSIIAIFILLIACINFMNLSTAKASRRIKEVGIKKAIGAGRSTLISQYLGESLLMTFVSLLTAIVLVALLLPQFNIITGKQLSFDFELPIILTFLGITLITGLIAGSYPALYLSGFNPATVLKGGGTGKFGGSVGEVWARKGLVVFQFVLSVVLIVSVWVVYQQISFVQNKNLGYDKKNVVSFSLEGKVAENPETFLGEMKRIPGVINASIMQQNIVGNTSTTVGLNWEGKNPEDVIKFQNFSAGYDMIETLGLEMASGRSFSHAFSSDSTALIFNEAAIEVMGLSDPIGATVNLWGQDRQIIGIVKDFHFESLHEEVKPMYIKLGGPYMTAIAKVEAGKEQETLASMQNFYQSFNPGYSFDYQFVDADYQALYAAEQRVSTLSKYFAGLAILISCLGLFGLAAFTAERRLKEIGIRKILGSSNFGIVRLLSGDFTKMVFTAILIALPLSYVIAQQWLESFAFQIDLAWWYFAGAGCIALLIAWFTVGLQTVKAAMINPAQCLKDE